jgi:predicted Rossmann fold flavoprotein
MENKAHYDIVIVGAGASGLMAAIRAAQFRKGTRIAVLEKNDEPAKKLYATGNGRCNYLNRNAAPGDYYCNEFPGSIPDAVESVMSREAVPALIQTFKGLGIEPREEAEGRMYPRSQQAKSVVTALVRGAVSLGAELVCNAAIESITRAQNFTVAFAGGGYITADKLIIACGGKAGIQYGCTGDGYRYARGFGHQVIKPIPALTQLVCRENMQELHGVRAEGRISLLSVMDGAVSVEAEDRGEIQFTKEGLSGICTFNISRFYKLAEGVSYRAELDLMEEYSEEKLREMMLERRLKFLDGRAGDLLLGLLPEKLGCYLVRRAGLDPEAPMASLSITTAEKIAGLCRSLEFELSQTKGWKEAQVTAGGVALSELDPETLESQLVPGLYFAGEVVDVDGPCGGYNLSWAFGSGFIAGLNAARSL